MEYCYLNKECIMGDRRCEDRLQGEFDRHERSFANQTADLGIIEFDYYKN